MKNIHFSTVMLLCMACARIVTESRGLPILQTSDFVINVDRNGTSDIKILYTGCGGLIIRAGDEVLMTDPYYTDHDIRKVLFGRIKPDTANWQYLARIMVQNNISMANLKGVLVSHAHYDHMEDLPWLLHRKKLPAGVPVLASSTAGAILKPCISNATFIDADRLAYDPVTSAAGTWTTFGTAFRVLPIASEHSPHYHGIRRIRCKCTTNCTPSITNACVGGKTCAGKWKEGSTYTYIIEVTHNGRKLRVFLQPTASNATIGYPPPDQKDFDLAFLCMASFGFVKQYPEAVAARINAKKTVIVHWENFFDEFYRKVPAVVPLTHPECFYKRLLKNNETIHDLKGRYYMPKPGTVMEVRY